MCPACGSSGIEPLFDIDDFHYVSCQDCGSGRLYPLPGPEVVGLYDRDYFEGGTVTGGYSGYGADEPLHRRNAHARLDIIRAAGKEPPGRIVELGSGYGFFLAEARAAGWDVTGADISSHARQASAALGVGITEGLAAVAATADVFAAFQVFEHMPDPFKAFQEGVSLLEPGGMVVVETWDRSHRLARIFGKRWQQASPPAVIHLFTGAGLRTMAARAGLENIAIQPSAKTVSVAAVSGQLATQHPRLERPLARIRDSRVGRRPLTYRLGDLVTLTARKPG